MKAISHDSNGSVSFKITQPSFQKVRDSKAIIIFSGENECIYFLIYEIKLKDCTLIAKKLINSFHI